MNDNIHLRFVNGRPGKLEKKFLRGHHPPLDPPREGGAPCAVKNPDIP